jgi:hypothetical protein
MRRIPTWSIALAALAISGCGTPRPEDIARDTTKPDFVEIRVSYQRAVDSVNVASEVIPTSGFVRRDISRDNRIALSVLAVDVESGISNTLLGIGEYRWTCEDPLTSTAELKIATLVKTSNETRGGTAVPGTPYVRLSTFTFDPFSNNSRRLVCRETENASTLSIKLDVQTVNGKGLASTTGQIEFLYLPRPATLPPATSDFCGTYLTGETFRCPGEQICAARRKTVCSGWWIFKTCDRIQTTDLFCQPV